MNYYMRLLESRSKRLVELIDMAAPIDMICKEVKLLAKAVEPLDPTLKSWVFKENINEECQPEKYQCTG